MPPPSPGSNKCGDHCGFIRYNNQRKGFKPDPGTTTCVAKVRIGTVYQSNANYHLLWRVSALKRDCAADSGTTEKTFNSNPKKTYVFTVYFKPGHCPAEDTEVFLELKFQ